ncbi:TetR family transcriptional regulator C-terminal domain-containing protein [Streptomyces sp. NPDC094143]|uniref:TetR family transcriptional regulator C-terminal domain-containing protein n=1 Tax=Streptomyces sp. NPDC094143 TaxID=3155310 RepID=UPI00331E6F5D
MDRTLAQPGQSGAERLMAYWQSWRGTQSVDDCQGQCLVVKLGAEVSDLSEPMRLALMQGTDAIIDRLERTIASGLSDGSIAIEGAPHDMARGLYDMWLGASVMTKIHRHLGPLGTAEVMTRRLLHA